MNFRNTDPVARSAMARTPLGRRAALAGLLALGVACSAPASADTSITIVTQGVVTSGSNAGNLLGLGTNLVGDAYQLSIRYDDPIGPTFYSDGSTVAEDFDALTGVVTLTIAGQTLTAPIVTSYGAQLVEDHYDLASSNAGVDAAGNYVDAAQSVSSPGSFVAVADLQSHVSRNLVPGDSGTDSFQYDDASFTQAFGFTGTTSSIVLTSPVPEPGSWALMAAALAAIGFVTRRKLRLKPLHPVMAAAALALGAGTDSALAAAATNVCSPLTYGASADGLTDNTVALQAAIDNCAAAGGGIVALPPVAGSANVYLTAPIQLRSQVLLEVDKGVTLQGTNDESRYTPGFIDYPYRLAAPREALISAYQATGTGIIGAGTIDGAGNQLQPNGGASWWTQASAYAATHTGATNPTTGIVYYLAPYDDVPTSNGMPRPWLTEFYQCNGVTVTGVTFQNSPMWHLVFRFSNKITVSGITVNTSGTSPNTDGIDIVGSTNVTVSGVHLADGDDDIAIKSGLPIGAEIADDPKEAGLPVQATSKVLVTNAVLGTGHGISIGSEAAYGVNDVTIQNVTWNGTSDGFRIKTGRDRGAQIFGISLSNLVMTNVPLPISIQAFYPGSSAPSPDLAPIVPTATTPYVHDITIDGLTATGATSQSVIEGLPESCMLRVNLSNVRITTTNKGLGLENMTGTFDNVTITPSNGPTKPFVVNENVTVATTGSTPAFANGAVVTAVPCAAQPQQD